MAASTASLAPGLSRKVKKILDIKTEGQDLVGALSTLSTFYEDNSQAARRSLRSTIEKRSLGIHEQFLQAAEAAIKELDVVQAHLDALSGHCQCISQSLASTKQATAPLLSDMDRLQRDMDTVERKGALIKEFLEQYQLAPEEVTALQGEEVGPVFFSALARVRQIHDNCRSLLRTHHQRAGLELMDMMATYQETAYERLCRWVQGECRNIGEFDAPEVDPMLQQAVKALRERPVLFKYCAEEVATARHNALFQRFITALTRGGPGGMPRPIEIHAHDPKRYINDMLAWVHQALAGEREFVVALFGEDKAAAAPEATGSSGRSSSVAPAEDGSADSMSTAQLLDRIFESICRPLKVRIEQVLLTSPPLLLCFQLAQLHSFYLDLVTRTVGHGTQLAGALLNCRDMAKRTFFEQLKSKGDKLLRNPPPPPRDLSPPPQVAETVHQLLEVVGAFESALESSAASLASGSAAGPGAAAAEEELAGVLAAGLQPLVQACARSAEALAPDAPSRVDDGSKLDPRAHRIYQINCLVAIVNAMSSRKHVQPHIKPLVEAAEGHISALAGSEVGRILARCGLAEVLERVRLYRQDPSERSATLQAATPASDPELPLQRLADGMRSFFVLVSSPDALPEFTQIQAPRTRADAVARVSRSLVEAYSLLYSTVDDPAMGYQEQGGVSAIKNTPQQVMTILGIM